MKRCLVLLLLLLVGGAIVNVAVAWGCGMLSVPDGQLYWQHDTIFIDSDFTPFDASTPPVMVHRVIRLHDKQALKSQPMTSCSVTMLKGPGIRSFQFRPDVVGFTSTSRKPWNPDSIDWLNGIRWTARFQKHWIGTISAQGWPLPTLWYGEFDSDGIEGAWHISDEQLPGYLYFDHALAYHPIWPAFAINTVFYAALLWLLFAGPFVVRRWRRIRRGLCAKCAYDLRGSVDVAACPECGAQK